MSQSIRRAEWNDALAEITGMLSRLLEITERGASVSTDNVCSPASSGKNSELTLAEHASDLVEIMRRRDRVFGKEIQSSFAWEALLYVLSVEPTKKDPTVSEVCKGSGGPITTVLRGIAVLTEMGLLRRVADPHDKRKVFLHLEDSAKTRLSYVLGAA